MSTLIIGNRFRKGILLLLSIILVLVVVGVILPSSYHVERSIIIKQSNKSIFPYLNKMQKWPAWTALNINKDYSLELNYFGPMQGIGSGMTYQGDKLGKGTITIIDNEMDDHVVFTLLINNRFNTTGNIQIDPQSDSTAQVTLTLDGDVGFHLPNRFIILLMDNIAGSLFQESLNRLKTVVELKKTSPIDGL